MTLSIRIGTLKGMYKLPKGNIVFPLKVDPFKM